MKVFVLVLLMEYIQYMYFSIYVAYVLLKDSALTLHVRMYDFYNGVHGSCTYGY